MSVNDGRNDWSPDPLFVKYLESLVNEDDSGSRHFFEEIISGSTAGRATYDRVQNLEGVMEEFTNWKFMQ